MKLTPQELENILKQAIEAASLQRTSDPVEAGEAVIKTLYGDEVLEGVSGDAPDIVKRIGELTNQLARRSEVANQIDKYPGQVRACHVSSDQAHWLIWHGGYDVQDGAFVPRKKPTV